MTDQLALFITALGSFMSGTALMLFGSGDSMLLQFIALLAVGCGAAGLLRSAETRS